MKACGCSESELAVADNSHVVSGEGSAELASEVLILSLCSLEVCVLAPGDVVVSVQVGDVERCLTERGYAKFTLTDRQDRELKRYPKGSDARRQFLYRLASAAR